MIFEIKLDFSKKVSTLSKAIPLFLEYEDLINFNFNHHHYTNKELCAASVQIF